MVLLEDLDITVGTYNILKKNGFSSLEDVGRLNNEEISNLYYMTDDVFFEIVEVLKDYKQERLMWTM